MTQRIFTLHEIAERLNRCFYIEYKAVRLNGYDVAHEFGLECEDRPTPFTVPANPAEGET